MGGRPYSRCSQGWRLQGSRVMFIHRRAANARPQCRYQVATHLVAKVRRMVIARVTEPVCVSNSVGRNAAKAATDAQRSAKTRTQPHGPSIVALPPQDRLRLREGVCALHRAVAPRVACVRAIARAGSRCGSAAMMIARRVPLRAHGRAAPALAIRSARCVAEHP
jgi:hypothetical protein